MSRATKLVIVITVIAAALALWIIPKRGVPGAPQAERAADAWLALRLDVHAAGPGEPIVVAATVYDRRARQASIVREATAGRYRGTAVDAPAEPRVPDAGWPSRLILTTDAGQPLAFTLVESTPAPPGSAVLRIPAAATMPAAIAATLVYDAGEARSNVATLPPAPASPADRLIAVGRQAEVVGDAERLVVTGAELTAMDAASPWGHYYSGVGHEIRGEKSEALAAFGRALARAEAGYEPPIGLIARINRLRQ